MLFKWLLLLNKKLVFHPSSCVSLCFLCFIDGMNHSLLLLNLYMNFLLSTEVAVHRCAIKICSEKFRKIHWKPPVPESLLSLQLYCNFIKKEITTQVFSCEFAKLIRTSLLLIICVWLLLTLLKLEMSTWKFYFNFHHGNFIFLFFLYHDLYLSVNFTYKYFVSFLCLFFYWNVADTLLRLSCQKIFVS